MRWLRYLIPLLLVGLFVMLYRHDPSATSAYPSCPFHQLTGLECPGCGSQRALHHLLHGRYAEAFAHNAVLIIALPLAVIHLIVVRRMAGRGRMFNRWFIVVWVLLILGWGVVRNLCPGA